MAGKLNDLTIKNNFLFCTVMSDPSLCRLFLELVLGINIAYVETDSEKNLLYHPSYHGVRLDVYARDDKNTRYNVDMQVLRESGLERRTRYYHSQMDMNLLLSGMNYEDLPKAYVIFICDFDPFGMGKYRYQFCRYCDETGRWLEDGSYTVFLSTRGKNCDEVSEGLVKFLQYVSADVLQSQKDFQDDFVEKIQEAVAEIKKNREMGRRYMLFELMMRDKEREGERAGRLNGQREALLCILEELGPIPEDIRLKIKWEKDLEQMTKWIRIAAKVSSVEDFVSQI